MAENTELELLITVVVAADDDLRARHACQNLVRVVGGRIVESGDCSDEEPHCWSVTISRAGESVGHPAGPALSRAVRNVLRELGADYTNHRVSCEPPTAWTVIENPQLVRNLVVDGERLLIEAWLDGTGLAGNASEVNPSSDDLPSTSEVAISSGETGVGDQSAAELGDVDENGDPRPRIGLTVDVVTERHAGAEWPARALASRLSREVTITSSTERPPMVRVSMDLGPAEGELPSIVEDAVAVLGGDGWSRLRVRERVAVVRWSAAPTPPSGIAAIELFAVAPESAPPTKTAGNGSTMDRGGVAS